MGFKKCWKHIMQVNGVFLVLFKYIWRCFLGLKYWAILPPLLRLGRRHPLPPAPKFTRSRARIKRGGGRRSSPSLEFQVLLYIIPTKCDPPSCHPPHTHTHTRLLTLPLTPPPSNSDFGLVFFLQFFLQRFHLPRCQIWSPRSETFWIRTCAWLVLT